MSSTATTCERCHNPVDPEDLFCDYCGHEIEGGGSGEGLASTRLDSGFAWALDCKQCGATLRYDEKVRSPRCAFCGSQTVEELEEQEGVVAPEQLVPFAVDAQRARNAIKSWLGKGFWRPGDLAERARLAELRPVYLPYWVWSADVAVHWAADTNDTPPGARASWRPCSGYFETHYRDLLVEASGAISAGELQAIAPFDFTLAEEYSAELLQGKAVQDFGVSRRRARQILYRAVDQVAESEVARHAPGSKLRKVSAACMVSGASSRPTLLPVWIAAYRYRERPYRVVLNGQSARLSGKAPISWLKVVAAIAIAAALGVLALGLIVASQV